MDAPMVFKVMEFGGILRVVKGICVDFEGVPVILFKVKIHHLTSEGINVDIFPNTWFTTREAAVNVYVEAKKQEMDR